MLPSLAGLILLAQTGGANDLDFWVGDWTCVGKSRNASGKDEWTVTRAENSIKRTLKDRVIQENFKMDGFRGQSWSVFDPVKKVWRQTWVDDSGAYLLFEGARKGDEVILRTLPGKAKPNLASRMVFRDIKPSGFTWDWEKTVDGGKTWELMWTLAYKRRD